MTEQNKRYHFSPLLGEVRECRAKSQETCPYCNAPHFSSLKDANDYANEMHDCFATMKKFDFLDNDYMHKDRGLYGDGGRLGDTKIHSYKTVWYYDNKSPETRLQCENVLFAAGLTKSEVSDLLLYHDSFVIVNPKDPEVGIGQMKVILNAQQNIPELKSYFATHTKDSPQEQFNKVVEYYRYTMTDEYITNRRKELFNGGYTPTRHLYERAGYFPSPLTTSISENYIIGLKLNDKKLDRDLRNIYPTDKEDFKTLKK